MPRDPSTDLIYSFVVRCVAAGLSRERARQLERDLRDQYGGQRIYVRAVDRAERPTARAAPAGHGNIADAARERA